jgi:RHS repeat-associated protein
MTLAYNALNLPDVFTFTSINPNNRIEIGYDAGGMKLEKQVFTGSTLSIHKRYVGGIEYTGANLEGIYHAEGRLTPNGANFRYEYTLKDHLGNSRVSFAANGSAIQVLQENHYYPFGMEMRGSWITQSGTENAYQYNGKELNEDFSLNWSDYGARWYDASVGRWNAIDPSATLYYPYSPYCYVVNRPLNAIDPDGRLVIFVNGFYPTHYLTSLVNNDNKKTVPYIASIPMPTGASVNNPNYNPTSREFNRTNPSTHGGTFDYWGGTQKKLWGEVYSDNNRLFVNASSSPGSTAASRFEEGKKAAADLIRRLDSGDISLDKSETIKVIAHSQGAAFAAGMISGLVANEKYGKLIEDVQYISPHQPGDFEHPAGVNASQWSSSTDKISSKNSPFTGYSELAPIKGVRPENIHIYDKRNESFGGHPADSYLNEIISYFRSLGIRITVIGK